MEGKQGPWISKELLLLFSRSVVSDPLKPHGLWPATLLCLWDLPGKNTGVGCHFLLQGIFLTQRLKPCLLHWQADSLLLRHWGKEKRLVKMDQSKSRYKPEKPVQKSMGQNIIYIWRRACRYVFFLYKDVTLPLIIHLPILAMLLNFCWTGLSVVLTFIFGCAEPSLLCTGFL